MNKSKFENTFSSAEGVKDNFSLNVRGCEKGKSDFKSTFQNCYGQKDSAVSKRGIGKFLSESCPIRKGSLRSKSTEISASSSSPNINLAYISSRHVRDCSTSSRKDPTVGLREKNMKYWTNESPEYRQKLYKNLEGKTLKKVDRSWSPFKFPKLEYETISSRQLLSRLTRAKDPNEMKMNHSDSTDRSLYDTFDLTGRIFTRNRPKSRSEAASRSFSNECNFEKEKGGFQNQFSGKIKLSKIENGDVELESSRKILHMALNDQDIEKLPCGESGKWKYIRMYQERARRREARRRRQREKEREESGGKSRRRRRRSKKRRKSKRRRRSSSRRRKSSGRRRKSSGRRRRKSSSRRRKSPGRRRRRRRRRSSSRRRKSTRSSRRGRKSSRSRRRCSR